MDLIREIDDLSRDFHAPSEPQKVLDALVARLVNRYPLGAAGIWRVDAGKSHLTLSAAAGGPEFPASWREVSASHSPLGRAAQGKLPQSFSGSGAGSTANGDELAQWAASNHYAFLTAFPLAGELKSLGVLLLAANEAPDEVMQAFFRLHVRIATAALHDAELVAGLQHNVDRLQSMVEASKIFNSTLDLLELLGKILDVAKTLTTAERGTLFLVDDKKDEIWSMIAQGMEKQEIRLPAGAESPVTSPRPERSSTFPTPMRTIASIPKSTSARDSARGIS